MPKINVMFFRFPGGNAEHPCSSDWVNKSAIKAKADPRISEVDSNWIADTPITMSRNRAIEVAKEAKTDLLFMIDSDMKADILVGQDPLAKPFFDVAMDLYFNHQGPFILAAPYCGPPPHENVYVFRWRKFESDHPNEGDFALEMFTREEAAERGGIEEVAALPTGLIAIDMRLFTGFRSDILRGETKLAPPYFKYEWSDVYEQKKGSTEDVYFTRNASMIGCPNYCAWDSWAGHIKQKCVGKPTMIVREQVAEEFGKAWERNRGAMERLVQVGGPRRQRRIVFDDHLPLFEQPPKQSSEESKTPAPEEAPVPQANGVHLGVQL